MRFRRVPSAMCGIASSKLDRHSGHRRSCRWMKHPMHSAWVAAHGPLPNLTKLCDLKPPTSPDLDASWLACIPKLVAAEVECRQVCHRAAAEGGTERLHPGIVDLPVGEKTYDFHRAPYRRLYESVGVAGDPSSPYPCTCTSYCNRLLSCCRHSTSPPSRCTREAEGILS